MRRRDEEVKKDILATIVFLTTGLLFYMAQVDGAPEKALSSADESGVVETIVVEKAASEGTAEVYFKHPRTRDS